MVNAQAERVFGYERNEMLGQPIEMLVPERFRRQPSRICASSFFSGPVSRPMGAGRDLFGLKKDGSEFPIEIGLNPIETDEGTMVLSAIVDISDRKHKEESIHAALKEKDVLLGEIHHRVKNNLQIVHSLLDLQSTNITDELVIGMMRESQNRIRSMALIHQTLYESKDFARVDFRNFLDSLVPTLVSSYGVGSDACQARSSASSRGAAADQRRHSVRPGRERADLERAEACASRTMRRARSAIDLRRRKPDDRARSRSATTASAFRKTSTWRRRRRSGCSS